MNGALRLPNAGVSKMELNMDKLKRIGALAVVVILVALYITTFVLAFMKSPEAKTLFTGCIIATIGLPVVLYAMMLAWKFMSGKK